MSALAQKTNKVYFEPDGLIDRARGAYLGLAVGDALGATVEFMTPNEIRTQYGEHRDIIGGGWLNLKRGHITDDTEMSLALGASILRSGGIDAEDIAKSFDAWLKTKPVDVGSTVRRGIVRYRTHGTLEGPVDDYDAGNGAVMRVLPVILATLGGPIGDIHNAAIAQAHITHNAPLSDAGMMCVINMTHRALFNPNGAYKDMIALAHDLRKRKKAFNFIKKPELNPSGFLPHTLKAVFQAFSRTDNFESALIDVVNRGGDADTTGAILGFMAGALYGMEGIPQRWLKALDKSVYESCENQALGLIACSPLVQS